MACLTFCHCIPYPIGGGYSVKANGYSSSYSVLSTNPVHVSGPNYTHSYSGSTSSVTGMLNIQTSYATCIMHIGAEVFLTLSHAKNYIVVIIIIAIFLISKCDALLAIIPNIFLFLTGIHYHKLFVFVGTK